MEGPPSSKRVATVGCDNNREFARHGVEVDSKWQHRGVYKRECSRGPVWAGRFLSKAPTTLLMIS